MAQISKTFSSALNLNQYANGVTSPASDVITMWLRLKNDPLLTSLVITFSSGSGNLSYTWASSVFPPSADYVWTNISAKKSAFTGDQAGWITISGVTIAVNQISEEPITLDSLMLGFGPYSISLSDMEDDETWVIAGTGGVNVDKSKLSEGVQSIYLNVSKSTSGTATRDIATKDLTSFVSAEEVSTVDDYISFWCYWNTFNDIKSIKLLIDCNADDYSTDFFEYEITQDIIRLYYSKTDSSGVELENRDNRAADFNIKKSEFTRHGNTAGKGWDTVQGYRFYAEATATAIYPLLVYFDNLVMKRNIGISGLYQWCCVFQSPTAYSAPSQWSEIFEASGTPVLLTHIPISVDSNVMARHIFRKGGTWGDEARLDFSLYENISTEYISKNRDEILGRTLNDIDIPSGTIRVPVAGKWGPVFKGSAILYRDPADYRRVWFSNPAYYYAWSELRMLIMDSDVSDIFLDDGILYISCKNGMRRIQIPLDEVSPTDIEEIGDSKISVSPYASVKAEQFRIVVSYDGVYVFNGQTFSLMSQNIDTYFNEIVYNLGEAIAFYADQHLYISVKTLTGVRVLLDAYGLQVQWRTSTEDINCFCVFNGIGDNGEIYVGDSTGTVYQFNLGYETLAQAITKDFGAEGEESDPFNDIILTEVHIIAKSLNASAGQIQLQFRKNQTTDTGVTLLFPASGHLPNVYTVYSKSLRGEYNEIRGNKIGAILTHNVANKHCGIQTIKLVGEITPLTSAYE